MDRFDNSALRDQLRVLLLAGTDRHGLPPNAIADLVAAAWFDRVGSEESLFGSDDQTDFVAFNVVGVVRVLCPGPKRMRTLMYVKPGEFVLTGPLFEGRRRRRAFVAVGHAERTTVAIWGEPTISTVLGRLPDGRSTQVMICASSATTGVLRDKCLMLDMRLAARLLFGLKVLARSFGELYPGSSQGPPRGVLITLELTHEELADLVFATRARVTDALDVLTGAGYLGEVDGRIVIERKGLDAPLDVQIAGVKPAAAGTARQRKRILSLS